jgi:hypothetical protein
VHTFRARRFPAACILGVSPPALPVLRPRTFPTVYTLAAATVHRVRSCCDPYLLCTLFAREGSKPHTRTAPPALPHMQTANRGTEPEALDAGPETGVSTCPQLLHAYVLCRTDSETLLGGNLF